MLLLLWKRDAVFFQTKVVPIGKSVAVIGKIVDGQMALLLATV
jgi:hypothetical protein